MDSTPIAPNPGLYGYPFFSAHYLKDSSYNIFMLPKPASTIFWFFILAAALFVGSRSFFSQGSCTCLSEHCVPEPMATVPQVEVPVEEGQLTQRP